MDTVRSSRNVADVVQQLAATLQPTISLEVWGHICAAVLRTIEHDASRVIQSLLKRDTVLQVLPTLSVLLGFARWNQWQRILLVITLA